MKSILVIGMGRFGHHLAKKLSDLGNDVMIVDKDPALVEELAHEMADARIGDATSPAFLRSLGIEDFDMCIVTVGEGFQASLETTSLLKDMGARYVISKSQSAIQSKFLLRNGADEVIYPELDMAEKLAARLNENVFDYIELTSDYAIYEIPVPQSFVGKSIGELNLRAKYRINVLAIKLGQQLFPMPGPDYAFAAGDYHMIVMGRAADVHKLAAKK